MRLLRFAAVIFLTGPTVSAAGADLKVKTQKIAPPAQLNEAIKGLLSDEALVIEDGTEVASTIWFRKEIPLKATAEQVKNGITYREIPTTTLIGAILLPHKWTDFRKQEIPKGVYTLRLATQPMDGDHMGTAPHVEFCLLCPPDKDTKPGPMDVKALRELSASSHDSTHPAVLLLFPNYKPEDQPKIVSKGNGIFVLNIKREVVAGGRKHLSVLA